MPATPEEIQLDWCSGFWRGRFQAMASPCEILIDSDQKELARSLTVLAAEEAWRIEKKYSRYRKDSIVAKINLANATALDDETSKLIEYAAELHKISDGLFDITSGVLRKAWHFDGSNCIPDSESIQKLLPYVGWHKVDWKPPQITLMLGMQIDLGGIGKEYAVDRCQQLIHSQTETSCLINFGGDLAVTSERKNKQPWLIGVEAPDNPKQCSDEALTLKHGALATSGDVKRYLVKDGKRYGHILNPKTGWPIKGAPRSVTVAANTCTEAGMLATLAMLQGDQCEKFIKEENIQAWCIR